mgnify:CR=1 FL=1
MTTSHSACDCETPGAHLDAAKMPGHWLLARLGKKVLRPGGLELTRRMLSALALSDSDDVVEFAPGLGATARMALAANPASYTAIERDATAAARARAWIERWPGSRPRRVATGLAQKTDLPDASASVVYGEAMLTMHANEGKREIIREAYRLLKPGGRYGIHELSLLPDDITAAEAEAVSHEVTQAIRHRAVPLSVKEWAALLASEGFEVDYRSTTPMALLNPARLISDEGLLGALRFLWRVLRDPAARARVLSMRRTFNKNKNHLGAICLVTRKAPVS